MNNKVVYLEGDLTIGNVVARKATLAQWLQTYQASEVVFDFSRVANCDSAGLALIIDLIRCAAKLGKSLRLTHLSQQMLDLVTFCGVDELISRNQ